MSVSDLRNITAVVLLSSGSAGYLCSGDAVDEADLLEALLAHGQTHLPAIVHRLVYYLQCHAGLIQLILHIQIHVAAEAVYLQEHTREESM